MTISVQFWAFLALLFPLYFCLPRRFQPALLLGGSLLFYAANGWRCLGVPLGLALLCWFFARLLNAIQCKTEHLATQLSDRERRKALRRHRAGISGWVLAAGIILLFLPFILWRTAGGTLFGLRPLGIAYMTLSAVGYLVDVYRGDTEAASDPLSLLLFLTYFPTLWQGPVSRYGELFPALTEPHAFSAGRAAAGGLRAVWGLFKKLVVGDTAALLCASLKPGQLPLLVLLYSVELYGDFTGGMDVSLGISRALGIDLYENFDRPFSAASLGEYWRRWHRSLGRWLTDYVFYPLSTCRLVSRASAFCERLWGERAGVRLPLYASVLLTWAAAGLWHGFRWNFLVWGLCNGVLLLLFRETSPLRRRMATHFSDRTKPVRQVLSVVGTLTLVGVLRLLDLCGTGKPLLSGTEEASTAQWCVVLLGAGLMFALESRKPRLACGLFSLTVEENIARHPYRTALVAAGLSVLVLLFGQYGIGYNVRDFLYGMA